MDLLKPVLSPRPLRDPFADPEVFRAEARAKVNAMLKSWINSVRLPEKIASATRSEAKAAKGASAAAAAAAAADPRDGLILSATSRHAGKGGAIINGHAYLIGDLVRDARTAEPCFLAEVLSHRVSLECGGKRFLLDYPIPTSSPYTVVAASVSEPAATPAKQGAKAGRTPARRTAASTRKPTKN